MLLKAQNGQIRETAFSTLLKPKTNKITLFPVYLWRSASELMTKKRINDKYLRKSKINLYYPIECYIISVSYYGIAQLIYFVYCQNFSVISLCSQKKLLTQSMIQILAYVWHIYDEKLGNFCFIVITEKLCYRRKDLLFISSAVFRLENRAPSRHRANKDVTTQIRDCT